MLSDVSIRQLMIWDDFTYSSIQCQVEISLRQTGSKFPITQLGLGFWNLGIEDCILFVIWWLLFVIFACLNDSLDSH